MIPNSDFAPARVTLTREQRRERARNLLALRRDAIEERDAQDFADVRALATFSAQRSATRVA